MKEKRYSSAELLRVDPNWADYVMGVLKDSRASPLAGFPQRKYTEWFRDPQTLDFVVRYEPAPN